MGKGVVRYPAADHTYMSRLLCKEEAEAAIRGLDGQELCGSCVAVSWLCEDKDASLQADDADGTW